MELISDLFKESEPIVGPPVREFLVQTPEDKKNNQKRLLLIISKRTKTSQTIQDQSGTHWSLTRASKERSSARKKRWRFFRNYRVV